MTRPGLGGGLLGPPGPAAVVADVDLQPSVVVPRHDLHQLGAGMAQRVRERLLRDPVRRQLHKPGQRAAFTVDPHLHVRQPGSGRPREVFEVGDAGSGRVRLAPEVIGVPQHTDGRPQLGQRLAAGTTYRVECLPGLVGRLGEQLGGHARLDVDHRESVGGHVVQFPRDPDPLFGEALRGGPVAMLGEEPQPGLELRPARTPAADGVAQ